jgi:multiple sugar transport system substrate-binding protein
MIKKLLIVFALMAILLTACAGGGEPAQPAESEEPAEVEESAEPADAEEPAEPVADEEPAADAKVTIRVWSHHTESFNAGYQALMDEYTTLHPEVEFLFETFDYDTYIQTLQTALPAGTEADIMVLFGSWVCSYAEGGNLSEVPASVISLDDAKAKILGAPIGGYVCDDKLYGIPQEFNIEYGAVLLNTAIAEEVGATNYVDGWESWDEVIEDGQKMAISQDDVMLRAGLNYTSLDGIATMFHSVYLQYGGQYLNDDTYTVNTPEGVKTLELMERLALEGLVDPLLYNDEENWVGESYFSETSAMGLVGPWAIPEYSGDYEDVAADTIYAPLPSAGTEPVFAAASGWGLTVSANSEVQEAAWDFVQFAALNADNATEFNLASGTLPALAENLNGANADALVAEFPYFEPFLGILEYGQYEGSFPDRDFVWYEVTYPEVLNFLQGNATIEKTLQTMESAVQASFE